MILVVVDDWTMRKIKRQKSRMHSITHSNQVDNPNLVLVTVEKVLAVTGFI